MAKKQKKIRKFRKPLRINIGLIIFLFIFIYITANVVLYFNRERLSIYEVVSTTMAEGDTITGLILRDEQVFTAEQSGFVNCYVPDGSRAAKKDVIYTIDETGSVYTQLTEAGEEESVPGETVENLQELITRYQEEGRQGKGMERFEEIYSLRDTVLSEVLQSSGSSMLTSLKALLKTYGDNGNFHVNYADQSGIVAFYTDGYEGRAREAITAADFEAEKEYQKNYVNNASMVEAGSPVYKLIPSESWSILLPLTEEQYQKLAEQEYVNITIRRDGINTTAAVSVYQNGGAYFAELTLQRYMVRYIGQRFLDVTLSLNQVQGLKIPKSAVVERQFYKVPLEYFTAGGDTSSNGLVKESFSENGETAHTFYATDLYYQDDDYGYISANGELRAGDRVKLTDSSDTYVISETESLLGVYNANKGYALFRRIEMLYENEEYCIVADNTQFGLSEYDHIILQGELAVDQALLR